jgi:hypothetical protein
VTPQARSSAPFELLRFTAAPITGGLIVLELEGRFRQSTRFARQPVLVIEPGADRPRIELTPVRTAAEGRHWEGSYAAPAEALSSDARLALGVRGTLLELPAPDEPDDGARFTALAREANALRRALELAESEAAAARAAAAAAAAGLDAAVSAARDAAVAASAERIDGLEHEVVEAHRLAGADAAAARAQTEAAIAGAIAETSARHEEAVADATSRAEAAEQHAEHAEARGRAAEEARLAAESRAARAEELLRELDDQDAPLTVEMAADIDAQARAAEAERELEVVRQGIEVLRAELVEERERSQATIAALERELDAARSRADALRHAAAAEGIWPATGDAAEGVAPAEDDDLAGVADRPEDDQTRVLRGAGDGEDDPDGTLAFSVAEQRDADADATQPLGPPADGERRAALQGSRVHDLIPPEIHAYGATRRQGPDLSRWVAVGALVLFAFVLLGLLLGFLG